ncbi:hypothetical protein L873DRAFT_674329 [Choiromyces venosus 120613-1]|uniref:Uncharacterized protein n=1 Tax=Choiromyces venosus 120613-1 TaxID=1336337 RepID=A0A3N4JVT5_9PEZI|nr:hypothetical protein L873DRAFT_674329 [Choiromyces venosus 120613-1]
MFLDDYSQLTYTVFTSFYLRSLTSLVTSDKTRPITLSQFPRTGASTVGLENCLFSFMFSFVFLLCFRGGYHLEASEMMDAGEWLSQQ